MYSIRFPALGCGKNATVTGEIIIDINSGAVKLNAYNGTKTYYPPFYKMECDKVYEPVVKEINKTFIKILDSIGVAWS